MVSEETQHWRVSRRLSTPLTSAPTWTPTPLGGACWLSALAVWMLKPTIIVSWTGQPSSTTRSTHGVNARLDNDRSEARPIDEKLSSAVRYGAWCSRGTRLTSLRGGLREPQATGRDNRSCRPRRGRDRRRGGRRRQPWRLVSGNDLNGPR